MHRHRRLTLGLLILTALASSLALLSCTFAGQPPPNSNFQWALYDEARLYIQGGDAFGFFYSLDLASSWDATDPKWTQLPGGPDVSSHILIHLRKRGEVTVYAGVGASAAFDIENQEWGKPKVLAVDQSMVGVRAVLSPDDKNLYYLLRSWPRSTLLYSGAVWSTLRNSILVYGGRPATGGGSVDLFYEYKVPEMTWSNITTTGPSPGPAVNHCMVSAHRGTRLIVFGGYNSSVGSTTGVGSIHILDLTTMVWTAGTPADPSQYRANHACAVAGDSFVAWGGKPGCIALGPFSTDTSSWKTSNC